MWSDCAAAVADMVVEVVAKAAMAAWILRFSLECVVARLPRLFIAVNLGNNPVAEEQKEE